MMGPMRMDGALWLLAAVVVVWLGVSGIAAQLLLVSLLRPRHPCVSRDTWLWLVTGGPLAATLFGILTAIVPTAIVKVDAKTLDDAAFIPLVAFLLWGLLDLVLLPLTRLPREDDVLSPGERRELRAMRLLAPQAVCSLVFAIAGTLPGCFPASFVAVYCGAKVLQRERASNDLRSSSASMATAGICLGTVTGVPTLVATLAYLVFYVFVVAPIR